MAAVSLYVVQDIDSMVVAYCGRQGLIIIIVEQVCLSDWKRMGKGCHSWKEMCSHSVLVAGAS